MTQKTALAELIEIVNDHKKTKGTLYGFTFTKKLQKRLLQKERQDLISAVNDTSKYDCAIANSVLRRLRKPEIFEFNGGSGEKYVKEKFGI